jgi:DNA-binding NtrC family response regulator
MLRILLIDDDAKEHNILKMAFPQFIITSAFSGAEGSTLFASSEYDLILLDIRLPDIDGIALLEQLIGREDSPPIVMLTAVNDIRSVVRAMQAGATNYIAKPFELPSLTQAINEAIILKRISDTCDVPETVCSALIGHDKKMVRIKKLIQNYAPSRAPVLITGECGTGKEIVARLIHELSPNREYPFIAQNCSAIPETLIETELFGSERGAYTDAVSRAGIFEQAGGGTILLDEIGELAPRAQVKLLRVLEGREVNRIGGTKRIQIQARIISATNKNLTASIEEGSFRRDLFDRISTLLIHIPPLRERQGDILILCKHFLRQSGAHARISQTAAEKLLAYHWPGNVRELKNVIERATVLAQGKIIQREHIVFSEWP